MEMLVLEEWKRKKRRGIAKSCETYSQRSAVVLETEASLLSQWFFLQLKGNQTLVAELSRTAFNEAQVVEVKIFNASLQRPEEEKE